MSDVTVAVPIEEVEQTQLNEAAARNMGYTDVAEALRELRELRELKQD